jgi:hypothetical protein
MSLNATPGDPAADSYFTIAEADTYFTSRGVAAWTGSTAAKEIAARLGTTYLENAYRDRWIGINVAQTQALAWPRIDGSRGTYGLGYGFVQGFTYPLFDINGWQIDPTTVPQQIKNAAMEASLLSLGGTALEPSLTRGGQIKSIGKTVGPLRKDIVYMDGAPAIDRYTVIEGLLRGLVTSTPGSTSGNTRLVRA